MMRSKERGALVLKRRESGETFVAIAKSLGISPTRAADIYYEAAWLRDRKPEPYDELPTMVWNALQSEFSFAHSCVPTPEVLKEHILSGKMRLAGGKLYMDGIGTFPNVGRKGFRSICSYLKVEPPVREQKGPSEKYLQQAKRSLERAGYKVIEPPRESPI